MGASSSTENVSPEKREAESLAASTGALPMLEKSFSLLSDPQTQSIPLTSLQQCFALSFDSQVSESSFKPEQYSGLLDNLGSSIVDRFFLPEKEGVSWVEFLRGYTNCCGRMPASISFNNLLWVFKAATEKAGIPTKLQFDSTDADCKISGCLSPADLLMLLSTCWVMSWDSRKLKSSKGNEVVSVPDINHLVLSAILSCANTVADLDVWGGNSLSLNVQLPVEKLHLWALRTVPCLPECLVEFVDARLCNPEQHEDKLEASSSSLSEIHSAIKCDTYLLTSGRAWAISLTLSGTMRYEILKACFPHSVDEINENLLYRCSFHGRGLNRFWSNIEGYNGPLLVLIAASSGDVKWVIGALTHQGFENKDAFYGLSGILYALSPVFNVFQSQGKEKNFVYSHLHPTGRVYEPYPKPVGIAFGGSIGNERIFMDEDFSKVTIRHHAADKTYLPGFIIPNQGFLPFEAQVLEVEVWGLGGTKAKEVQDKYKRREELFTEQRRKVDLKTFSSWEDSPEKMMMDMISDPNAVRREER